MPEVFAPLPTPGTRTRISLASAGAGLRACRRELRDRRGDRPGRFIAPAGIAGVPRRQPGCHPVRLPRTPPGRSTRRPRRSPATATRTDGSPASGSKRPRAAARAPSDGRPTDDPLHAPGDRRRRRPGRAPRQRPGTRAISLAGLAVAPAPCLGRHRDEISASKMVIDNAGDRGRTCRRRPTRRQAVVLGASTARSVRRWSDAISLDTDDDRPGHQSGGPSRPSAGRATASESTRAARAERCSADGHGIDAGGGGGPAAGRRPMMR
jgi:hypothetical protein